jgi:hypothetical protein
MRTTSASAKAFLPERHSRAFTISHNKLFSSSPQGGGGDLPASSVRTRTVDRKINRSSSGG